MDSIDDEQSWDGGGGEEAACYILPFRIIVPFFISKSWIRPCLNNVSSVSLVHGGHEMVYEISTNYCKKLLVF